MNSIYIIITALALTANTQGSTVCNLAEGNTICFGALGEPLLIHLTSNDEKETFQFKRDINTILTTKKQNCTWEWEKRCKLFPNGTLRLDSSMKKDSGDYQLETFDKPLGTILRKFSMKLQIQAPVSESDVSQECVSPEENKVSCSSKGDDLEFIWKLYNQEMTLTTSQSLSSATPDHAKLSSISLHGQLVGPLTCVVKNKVSVNQTVIQLTACGDSSFKLDGVTVIIAIIAATALNFLLALCVCIFILRKRTSSQTDCLTINAGNSERDSVIYADVTVNKKKQNARRPPPTNDQVVYGNVVFSSS